MPSSCAYSSKLTSSAGENNSNILTEQVKVKTLEGKEEKVAADNSTNKNEADKDKAENGHSCNNNPNPSAKKKPTAIDGKKGKMVVNKSQSDSLIPVEKLSEEANRKVNKAGTPILPIIKLPIPTEAAFNSKKIDLKDENGRLPYVRFMFEKENEREGRMKNWIKKDRAPNVEKVVGFYNICGEIGSGNFSKVKLGVHQFTRVKVAIKVIDKSRIDPRLNKMLMREISNMESLCHPNIIRLFEVIETPEKLHLICELAPGGDLYSKVKLVGKIKESDAKLISRQILSAVSFMHANSIIHRDLKCENIFFSNTPHIIKVGDLGFSIKTQTGTNQMLSTFCGSPPYAAPELYRDSQYDGIFVDIWAFGVILFYMIFGKFPFQGHTIPILKAAILAGEYEMPDTVSFEFAKLVKSILQQKPVSRITLSEIMHHPWIKEVEVGGNMKKIPIPPHKPTPIAVQNRFYLENPVLLGIPSEDDIKQGKVSHEEMSALKILKEIGIDDETITTQMPHAIRSHVVGIYRIILFRIHRGYIWTAEDFLPDSNSNKSKFLSSSRSYDSLFNAKKKNLIKNKTCSSTIIGEKSDQSTTCAIL